MRRRAAIVSAVGAAVGAAVRSAGGAAVVTALVLAAPSRILPQGSEGDVRVTITLTSHGTAAVHERYRVASDSAGWEFRILTRPCATIGDVRLSNANSQVSLARANRGPWLVVRDTTGAADTRDSSGFAITYQVTLGAASADVPLANLTRPIPRGSGEGLPPVTVDVDFAAMPGGTVTFPRFERHASERWSAHYVAIPSFVHLNRVKIAGSRLPAKCDQPPAGPADDGGLTWRFWLFVGVMAAWVPLYLTWAGRRREADA